MRQALNKSMIVMAAASGLLAVTGGAAHADASAEGAAVGSPGVGSGNAVQVPVHVPVNACGNTVNVIALLNPAFGNSCANVSSSGQDDDYGHGGGNRTGGSSAEGAAVGSPGVLSGNLVQAPVHVPVNVCGNTVNVVGALNPVFGNTCKNVSGPKDEHPPTEPPVEEPPTEEPPTEEPPTEEPPTEEPPTEEPPTEEPPTEEPPTEEPPTEQPPTEEPPTEQPPTEQPPVDEPPAEQPPTDTPGSETPGPNTPGTHTPGSEAPGLADTGAAGLGLAAGASAAMLLGGTVLMRRTRDARD
ncbi:chaplin [Streptomyces bacillaris]|uniref:chaplin n=1 Tax=Streptomyces bacillaris TaxID=68179 RepID=UPI0034605807